MNYAASERNILKGLVSIGNPLKLIEAEKKIEKSQLAKITYYDKMLKGRSKNIENE